MNKKNCTKSRFFLDYTILHIKYNIGIKCIQNVYKTCTQYVKIVYKKCEIILQN